MFLIYSKKVKKGLINTDTSVSDIAYALGFGYPQYFSRLFKSKTGMTPSHHANGSYVPVRCYPSGYYILRIFAGMKAAHCLGRSCLMVFFLITTISLKAISPTKPDTDHGVPHRENPLLSADDRSEQALISFAKKLLGVKYKYGAANPSHGFDCSGFVHYVFRQFGVTLPRSSSAIGQTGENIPLSDAKAGDIILFTGTNAARRTIGHVGIVLSNTNGNGLRFIHASSGKAYAVTETALEGSYKKRFMKVIRVI